MLSELGEELIAAIPKIQLLDGAQIDIIVEASFPSTINTTASKGR